MTLVSAWRAMPAKYAIAMAFLTLSLALAAQVFEPESAPEATAQPAVATAAAEETPAPAEDSVPASTSASGSFETFNPSEEISEDLSVPFPVDI